MFRVFSLLVIISLLFVSCLKNSSSDDPPSGLVDPNQPNIDEDIIYNYIINNNLNALRHSSGLYYVIDKEGEGDHPELSSVVEVKYSGYLVDGTKFDSGTVDNIPLSGFIVGWQTGISLFKPGGSGKLLIPSALAYGPYSKGDIPPNSVLIFDIELVNFE